MTTSKALIFTPHGRDAAIVGALLAEAKIDSVVCADLAVFHEALNENVSFAVVAEEATRSADLRQLAGWVGSQPTWSDLPFIIFTQRGGGPERNPTAARLSELLGNVTFLERPFHPSTFISVARTAQKGRQRQYESRARMEELHEGEERLRTALAAGRLGSWELDLATGELRASAMFKGIFGRAEDEPLNYDDLVRSIQSDSQRSFPDALWSAIEDGGNLAFVSRDVWPDGTSHWVDIRARLVKDRAAGTSRLVGVASDITDRKVSEEALRRLNGVLEERVAERTIELKQAHAAVLAEIEQRERAEDLLRQAQKMEMIGQLTGGVAHDFNNLLMAVVGNLDLLRKHLAHDAKASRLIDGAMQGAKRGAALTQRLLAFARRQDLQVEPRNLVELLRGMTDLIERSVGSQIELVLDLPEQLPAVLVDANQIELALLNLIVNARDAMPTGGVLTIEGSQQEVGPGSELATGPYVRVVVSDTGCGMNAWTLAKATEPFFSTKELGKGTGLGLSMVHGLAMQLNGALRLKSEVGDGTRAELWLPVTDAAPQDEKAEASAAIAHTARKLTVLVVDDDALIAMSTADMLEDLGHEAIEANSGSKALEILGNGRSVDLLITDYSMPKMNGAQLAEAVRQALPDLPILLVTGYADLPPGAGQDIPRISKPYQQGQLASAIAKMLAPRGAGAQDR
ncbi:ATP-binding protein [Chelatococcus sp. GCM10030263]|uniref:ATP-binding protein n=1 Tax=Chelatococcus sp. GCM10030263 TaxID=3273387 RepID=UPI0036107EE0